VFGIVLGFGFGGWDSSEAVHEALLVVPGDVVGGDVFDIAEGGERASAERGIGADALVLVESDRGLGQRIVVGIADTADRGPDSRKTKCFTESHACVLGGFNLSLVMRQLLGKGTPRGLQGLSADALLAFLRLWIAVLMCTERESTSLPIPVS